MPDERLFGGPSPPTNITPTTPNEYRRYRVVFNATAGLTYTILHSDLTTVLLTGTTSSTTSTVYFTDTNLVNGANTRYIRLHDGTGDTDTAFTVTANIAPHPITTKAAASSDDFQWSSAGAFNSTFGTTEFGNATGPVAFNAGVRMLLNVPPSATITNARLHVSQDTAGRSGTVVARIYGDKSALDPAAPTTAALANARALTTAFVDWSVPATLVTGEESITPDLSPILNEIIHQSGWTQNNHIILYIKENGSVVTSIRLVASFDSSTMPAATLYVDYAYDETVAPSNTETVLAVSDGVDSAQWNETATASALALINAVVAVSFETHIIREIAVKLLVWLFTASGWDGITYTHTTDSTGIINAILTGTDLQKLSELVGSAVIVVVESASVEKQTISELAVNLALLKAVLAQSLEKLAINETLTNLDEYSVQIGADDTMIYGEFGSLLALPFVVLGIDLTKSQPYAAPYTAFIVDAQPYAESTIAAVLRKF